MPGKRGPASQMRDVLANSAEAMGPLFLRYVDGFDDVTAIRQLSGIPNHVIWPLGHCGLTMHRGEGLLDGPLRRIWANPPPGTMVRSHFPAFSTESMFIPRAMPDKSSI